MSVHFPRVGDMVQFVLDRNDVRPAVILRVWSEVTVNLLVFLDGTNDHNLSKDSLILWQTSISYGYGVGQWHWVPELV